MEEIKKEDKHPEHQYLDLLNEIMEKGVKNYDRGTGVTSYSVFGRQSRYDMSKGFPLLTTKKTYWKGILHELYWFMSGQSNIKYLIDNNVNIWNDYPYKLYKKAMEKGDVPPMTLEEFVAKLKELPSDHPFVKKWGDLPHVYGNLWRKWPTKTGRLIDQLQWAVNELKEDPDARNAVVSVWNPEYLYSMATKEETSHFPVCHILYQFSIKNGKLNLQLYQRTCDMFLGVPFNIASYSLLLCIVAKILGVQPGEFIHVYGDAHIYSNHMDQVKEQLARTPLPFPTLKISDEVTSLDSFKPEHAILENYNFHPPIKGELTVAGGFFDPNEQKNNPQQQIQKPQEPKTSDTKTSDSKPSENKDIRQSFLKLIN
jgi:thymidylate synthase